MFIATLRGNAVIKPEFLPHTAHRRRWESAKVIKAFDTVREAMHRRWGSTGQGQLTQSGSGTSSQNSMHVM